jgi:putative phosphotransacetylase
MMVMIMKVKAAISARHIHLTPEDYNYLFPNEKIEKEFDLHQYGQYASKSYVTIVNKDREIARVRVLGPLRNYTQCEISKTDAFFLKLNPPVRDSGDLEGAEEIEIRNGNRKLIRKCVIIANRHIHIDPKTRQELNLVGVEKVKLRVPGEKGGILDNVHIKERNDFYYELHLDCDDANSHFISNDDELEIII